MRTTKLSKFPSVSLRGNLCRVHGGFVLVSQDYHALFVKECKETMFEYGKYPKDAEIHKAYDTRVMGVLKFDKKNMPYIVALEVG